MVKIFEYMPSSSSCTLDWMGGGGGGGGGGYYCKLTNFSSQVPCQHKHMYCPLNLCI